MCCDACRVLQVYVIIEGQDSRGNIQAIAATQVPHQLLYQKLGSLHPTNSFKLTELQRPTVSVQCSHINLGASFPYTLEAFTCHQIQTKRILLPSLISNQYFLFETRSQHRGFHSATTTWPEWFRLTHIRNITLHNVVQRRAPRVWR
jgi:hypothetical protein